MLEDIRHKCVKTLRTCISRVYVSTKISYTFYHQNVVAEIYL